MDAAGPLDGGVLLAMLTETIRGLEAVRRRREHHDGAAGGRRSRGEDPGRGGGGDEDEREEEGCRRRVAAALRELSAFHSDGVAAWGDALRGCARVLEESPAGGGGQRPSSATERNPTPPHDSFRDTCLSVGEDVQNILDKLDTIRTKLDGEILKLRADEASDAPERPESHRALEFDSGLEREIERGEDPSHTTPLPDSEQTPEPRFSTSDCSDVEETGIELSIERRGSAGSPESPTDFLEETGESDEGKEEANKEWITVGLTGQQQQQEGDPDVPDACSIKAPTGVAHLLRCEAADALSFLMVAGSEELVSRVIRVKVWDGARFHFPVTLAVPFCARYRGSCRDIAVKVVGEEGRASYITPVTTEGAYGRQRGSFAEVRVYSLGLFAVVSCLKREHYTVPTKGLSLKLPMDPRICLNYVPGSFGAPIMAQTMIQPVDAVLLAAVKSRSDNYHSVASTSPLLYLSLPSSQPLRRPLAFTLPCPPNPDRKRRTAGQTEGPDPRTQPDGASPPRWDQRRRILGASAKSRESSDELLIALCSRDKQWNVLDKVTVRNQQNGLVSFELTENFDRLLVVRLLSPLPPSLLTSLAEELEESVCRHSVTVVLQRRPDEPHAVLVAALPSRDLGWEMYKLRAQGYGGLPETSPEISMCEGDQLLLGFSGNITSTGAQKEQRDAPRERITFHSQQKNHLLVRLTEVDPFGNHSSPHYKGTALFYKVARGQLERRGDAPLPADAKLLGNPVCKLSLTLPKKARSVPRPIVARVKLCEETEPLPDSLLLWLSEELSEEEVSLLVASLRLRRSAALLVKLRAGDSPSAQAFHVLAMWRRGLPAAPRQPKASQLAHCLAKSGRPDLARELLLRQSAKNRNHTAF